MAINFNVTGRLLLSRNKIIPLFAKFEQGRFNLASHIRFLLLLLLAAQRAFGRLRMASKTFTKPELGAAVFAHLDAHFLNDSSRISRARAAMGLPLLWRILPRLAITARRSRGGPYYGAAVCLLGLDLDALLELWLRR